VRLQAVVRTCRFDADPFVDGTNAAQGAPPKEDAPMQYVVLIYTEERNEPTEPAAVRPMMAEYSDYTRMLRERGHLLAGEALQPTSTATTVRVRDGQTMTTDGPFAETKEALGGFYLIEAADLDEALELSGRCPGAKWGSVEVRPIVTFAADEVAG
jgi:hypothetical protein